MIEQRVLNAQDAAAYVGVARSTFNRQIASRLSRIQLTPGRVGYLREELDAWIESKTVYPEKK